MAEKNRIIVTPGYRSDHGNRSEAFLQVEERDASYALVRDFGEFTLRYLPDTHEVVLLKGDEAVYSELLDPSAD